MGVLWLWVMSLTAEIAAALAIFGNSTAVQRVVNRIIPISDVIASRASSLYAEAAVFAQRNGLIINPNLLWGLAKTAIDENWVAISDELVAAGVGPEAIAVLRKDLIVQVTQKVLCSSAQVPEWAHEVTSYPWFPWRW